MTSIVEKIINIFVGSTRNCNKVSEVWSGEEKSEIDIESVSEYHFSEAAKGRQCISEATWADLDMDDVFLRINRTCSAIGAQYLYHEMHLSEGDIGSLRTKYLAYREIHKKKSVAEKMGKVLQQLRNKRYFCISQIIHRPMPGIPRHFPVIVIMSLLFIASVVGTIFVNKDFVFGVLVFGFLNTIYQQVFSVRIAHYMPDLGCLGRMLNVASSLADTEEISLDQIITLGEHRDFIKSLQGKYRWPLLDYHIMDDLTASVVVYINNLMLLNVIFFYLGAKCIERNRKKLSDIYEAIGSLDALLAIAGYLKSETWCYPRLVDENRIDVTSIYHPNLEHPVSNSFSLVDSSGLITGSNMAGKTTFIKTIGINLIFAQSLGFVLGRSAVLPRATVLSTIRRRDSLKNGKSYYYVEIETINEFIKAANATGRCLFLIDEIFRGTNTLERLSAASSVLKYLGERGMVLVTTHDIELVHLLGDKYRMFHFQEQIKDGHHYFDYIIKPGTCRSRNAIKLLELYGYPAEIISEAYKRADIISRKSISG